MEYTELMFRPFPIRKIKNKLLRRVVMILMFLPLWGLCFILNASWVPFLLLINTIRSFIVLSESMREFWNDPDPKTK